ncbi:unnamed protein product, partial [marine sediment metagenome]
FDSLLGKLIVWEQTRERAINLSKYAFKGTTNFRNQNEYRST